MEIKNGAQVIPDLYESCHGGEGTVVSRSVLEGFDSEKFSFVHYDEIPAGTSVGLHLHETGEEIYYLLRGKGTLLYDENRHPMGPGDISLCKTGHSHGFLAETDCVMIVVGALEE